MHGQRLATKVQRLWMDYKCKLLVRNPKVCAERIKGNFNNYQQIQQYLGDVTRPENELEVLDVYLRTQQLYKVKRDKKRRHIRRPVPDTLVWSSLDKLIVPGLRSAQMDVYDR